MAYVDIAELKRVLGKPSPTVDEAAAMQNDIDTAAREIDWDLSFSVDNPAPPVDSDDWKLLQDVNLNRAVEWWRSHSSPFGAAAVAADMGVVVSPRDTWFRHHLALNPLRTKWPIG